MAGFINYNQSSDIGNTFGGVGDMLGSAILRGAMMRQAQAQRQQELMFEIARLRQEQENAASLGRYREEEVGLRKKEGEREEEKLKLARTKADEGTAEMAVRQRFARAARTEGLQPSQFGFGNPSLAAVKEYDEQKRQADINEGMAFLSNDPSRAMEGITRQAAVRSLADNPIINQILATGIGFHNAPPGASVFSPGGDIIGQGQSRGFRPGSGESFSLNTALQELIKMKGLPDEQVDPGTLEGLGVLVRQGLLKQLGTNAPASLMGGQTTTGKPITAVNPQTKQRIVSYDGGQTWQPAQ